MEKQITLSFNEEEHKYTDESNNVYTSVTTLIGQYKPPFNKRYWSMYTALKNAGIKVRPVDNEKAIVVNGDYQSLDWLYANPINNYEVKQLCTEWQNLTDIACERGNGVHN